MSTSRQPAFSAMLVPMAQRGHHALLATSKPWPMESDPLQLVPASREQPWRPLVQPLLSPTMLSYYARSPNASSRERGERARSPTPPRTKTHLAPMAGEQQHQDHAAPHLYLRPPISFLPPSLFSPLSPSCRRWTCRRSRATGTIR